MSIAIDPTIYTLGPVGTNCAAAAQWWLDSRRGRNREQRIVLHDTLEQAFDELAGKQDG